MTTKSLFITGKRKRKLDPRIRKLTSGDSARFGVLLEGDVVSIAKAIGFSDQLEVGETVLPPAIYGPVCRYNADGKEIVHRDRAKEKCARQALWHWQEFRGPYEKVQKSRIVDIPYERYPRTEVPPPSIELTILRTKDGKKCIATPEFNVGHDPEEHVVHMMNVALEIFGHCNAFSDDIETIKIDEVRRVHWNILPPGKHPWERLQTHLKKTLDAATEGRRVVVEHRIAQISKYSPEFIAIGDAGFAGYLVFGFPSKNIFVLESVYTGNATYVFESDWESLSRKTKADILHGNLQKDRIIHREGWVYKINNLLK